MIRLLPTAFVRSIRVRCVGTPFWVLLVALLNSFSGFAQDRQGSGRPNVLLIMLDDAGWTDLGCYGSKIHTPNIDGLAAQGIRFSDCHAAAPNCSPSRTGMLTGRIPSRVGMYSYIPPNHPMHLPDDELTIAEILKAHGYATGHFGKWHLSDLASSEQPGPLDQGFDYSLGTSNNAEPSHANPVNFVRNREPVGKLEGYSCQIVADEFIHWLDKQPAEQPFFSCVWFHEPHERIASPPELVEKYKRGNPDLDLKQANYFANIENADRAVGRILKTLESRNQSENTFVFLTSDNGGLNAWSVQGLRGKKSLVYEGGHREPGILRWPGHVPAGQIISQTVSHLDLLPTICDITGAAKPTDRKLDGTSWFDLLQGGPLERGQSLFWYFYRVAPAAAMRKGDWMILGYLDDPIENHTHGLTAPDMPMIKSAQLHKFELYNLRHDLPQRRDLADSEPERLAQLRQEMLAIHADVIQDGPIWTFK